MTTQLQLINIIIIVIIIFSIPYRIISNIYYNYLVVLEKCLSQTHTEILGGKSEGRGRDSAVGIATGYGLDDPGIKYRWGARFSASIQTGPRAHPASYTRGTGSFPGVERPGRAVDHPPPSSSVVEVRVELYLYSSFGPSWPLLE